MQVFVNRSSLSAAGPIRVLGYYPDETVIAPDAHGPAAVILSLAPAAIVNTRIGPTLALDWRDANREQALKGEAERRILKAFPAHEQRNAALELGLLAAQHGAGAWPKEALRRKAEIESAWTYVNAVRRAAKAMAGALPTDPTADAHWPKR
jgi:hypothetical protein